MGFKILFITLSNIGDVILTLPALDALRQNVPGAQITIMVGPRPKEIFQDNPHIHRLIVYDKHLRLRENIRLFYSLKKERFDIVVDLRNTLFGLLLPARYKNSVFIKAPSDLVLHKSQQHLYKIKNILLALKGRLGETDPLKVTRKTNSLYIKPEDEDYINGLLKQNKITSEDRLIIIAPGARSHIKRWSADKFLELIDELIKEARTKVILAGDKDDTAITKYITKESGHPLVDLAGKTSIAELACLLERADCLITNDSAVLHLASYLDVPQVAIFGPTDELKYGPWSQRCSVVKKDIFCRPCQKAQCRYANLKCMQVIGVQDVLSAVRGILSKNQQRQKMRDKNAFQRILVVRTDRIGDVLLSTPVLKALRDNFPQSYIAIMVSPYARDIVEGNPYLDEVIIYDKDARHRSWLASRRFALDLKRRRFDLAVILHPTNRVHLVTYFSGIPRRVGYDQKLGCLLTDRIKHTKHLGQKHELEYNLDLLRYLGIEPQDKNFYMPTREESEKFIDELLLQEGLSGQRLLAIHPGASCPSKIWPNQRFREVAQRLQEKYGFKVLAVGGAKDVSLADRITTGLQRGAINLAGKTSISQLASLLKRCELFISNDSGPVHIASAVGTPVISIFGRLQPGLSPRRWGPQGLKDIFIHKEVGCIECLAHNCKREFACLKAITVEDVLVAAASILES